SFRGLREAIRPKLNASPRLSPRPIIRGHNEPLDDETCTEVPGDRMRGLRTDRVQNKKPAPLKVAVRATFLRLAGLATMPLISCTSPPLRSPWWRLPSCRNEPRRRRAGPCPR